MRRPKRIAIVGIDGSGKSTSAPWLAGWLTQQGVPARHFKNPGGRVALGRLARRLGRRDAIELLGPTGYLLVEVVVRWLAIARAVLVSRLTGQVAVMDRYTFCQYAMARARGHRGERLIRALYAAFAMPDVTCWLAVDPELAQRRVDLRGTDTEDVDYLSALDRAYRSLPESQDWVRVDAGGDVRWVRAALAKAVGDELGLVPPRQPVPIVEGRLSADSASAVARTP